jgi:prepilin peptidase CpaA
MLVEMLPAAVASVAAATDIFSRRIPNWLCLAAFSGGLLVHVVREGGAGVPMALGGAFLGLVVFLPLYLIRAIGAGDVKLVAGLGALLGPADLVSVLVYCALVGGLMSMVMLARRGILQRSFVSMFRSNPLSLPTSGLRAPYGVAVAGGVYLSMLLPKVLG